MLVSNSGISNYSNIDKIEESYDDIRFNQLKSIQNTRALTDSEIDEFFDYLEKRQKSTINGYSQAKYPLIFASVFSILVFASSYITIHHFMYYFYDIGSLSDNLYLTSIILSASVTSVEFYCFYRLASKQTSSANARLCAIASCLAIIFVAYYCAYIT